MTGEAEIKLAIEKALPNIPIVHCWNHIKNDVKVWLNKHRATQDDLSVYMRDVRDILDYQSVDVFENKIETLGQSWSAEFSKYFNKCVKPAILDHSGRWILEELNIYDSYSGVTTNAAESLNNVIKSLQRRKELPIDLINLTLFYLQKYVHTEIQCGRAGFGNFKLKDEYLYAKLDPSEIKLPQLNGTPNDILQQAKSQLDIFTAETRPRTE